MQWRDDRCYLVASGFTPGVTPLNRPPKINIYSWMLWKGLESQIRKVVDYPRWGNRPHGSPLHLCKNTSGMPEAFWASASLVGGESICERLIEICPRMRLLPVVFDDAFCLAIKSAVDPGLSSEDEIQVPKHQDDPDESVDAWLQRLVQKYRTPIPTKRYCEVIAPATDAELAAFPVVRKIPEKDLGTSVYFRPEAVREYGCVWSGGYCVRADLISAIDQYLVRPYFRVIPIAADGTIMWAEI